MELKHCLIRPLMTEKSTSLNAERTYAFEVGLTANKIQVKEAIEAFYGVDVVGVRTLVVRGKVKRFGRKSGKRKNWKKAYVTLAEGGSIAVFDASEG